MLIGNRKRHWITQSGGRANSMKKLSTFNFRGQSRRKFISGQEKKKRKKCHRSYLFELSIFVCRTALIGRARTGRCSKKHSKILGNAGEKKERSNGRPLWRNWSLELFQCSGYFPCAEMSAIAENRRGRPEKTGRADVFRRTERSARAKTGRGKSEQCLEPLVAERGPVESSCLWVSWGFGFCRWELLLYFSDE